MKKAAALLVLFFVFSVVYAQNIEVTVNPPPNIEIGKPNKIEVSVSKGNVTGIARMQFELPKGLKAMEGRTNGGLFSFSNHVVQVLWIQLPIESLFTFDFSILPDSNYSGTAEIGGRLSYIVDTKKVETIITPLQLKISGQGEKSFEKYKAPATKVIPLKPAVAKPAQSVIPKPTVSANNPKPLVKTELKTPVESKKILLPKKEGIQVKKENPEKNKTISKTPEKPAAIVPITKKENITFKLQLAASSSMLDKTQLSKQFNYKIETINEEQINNMYKYTTGEFAAFKDAKKALTMNESLKGKAFIVGYKDGKRIDLEEAIQLSK